jgi:hypothetical protein
VRPCVRARTDAQMHAQHVRTHRHTHARARAHTLALRILSCVRNRPHADFFAWGDVGSNDCPPNYFKIAVNDQDSSDNTACSSAMDIAKQHTDRLPQTITDPSWPSGCVWDLVGYQSYFNLDPAGAANPGKQPLCVSGASASTHSRPVYAARACGRDATSAPRTFAFATAGPIVKPTFKFTPGHGRGRSVAQPRQGVGAGGGCGPARGKGGARKCVLCVCSVRGFLPCRLW